MRQKKRFCKVEFNNLKLYKNAFRKIICYYVLKITHSAALPVRFEHSPVGFILSVFQLFVFDYSDIVYPSGNSTRKSYTFLTLVNEDAMRHHHFESSRDLEIEQ